MGVFSRKVLPACESLCFFCPALRARSRHPVKRYKNLLSEIFPRSQDEEPNDRKISKLCEYAAKNPLRIPKITGYLEQRCYKELRSEQFQYVKVAICIYRKMMVSCKKQMSLFATSLLGIIHVLLDQTRFDELRVLGCKTLFEFGINQTDGTYMFNLDCLIPKLCLLAQELGEDGKAQQLRAAGLQALSSMVWFMGEFSHIPTEFDNVVSVVLENYGVSNSDAFNPEKPINRRHGKEDSLASDGMTRISFLKNIVNQKGEVLVSEEEANNPKFWSRVCLSNMAKLAKEATTVRAVFESFFRYFDKADLWSAQHGVAPLVLLDMQLLLEKFGQNSHFLLSILIKHLDHKNILKNPNMQLDIVYVATSLARQSKVQASVAITGAFSDMMRHLRKSIHCCLDDSNLGTEVIDWNRKYRSAVDECLVQLSIKIGDAGLALDVMAVMLENISNITVMTRTLVSAVYRTAQIVTCIPNLTYQNKAFPEALFHQLLQAMVCADHESRIGAHSIFSVVLIPSSVSPCPRAAAPPSKKAADHIQRTLSRNVSVFSSSAALFEKLKKEPLSSQEDLPREMKDITFNDDSKNAKTNNPSMMNRLKSRVYSTKKNPSTVTAEETVDSSMPNKLNSTYSQAFSSKRHSSPLREDEGSSGNLPQETQASSLRLSSHQISLMLSSIWVQSISPLNTPQNYEAIAHTYSLVLLFAWSKNSSNETLIQSFQLALSLRNFSIAEEVPLQPSRRRSLFTLAMCMIIFSTKAYNIPALILSVKAALVDKTVDPFLQLIGESKLQAVEPIVDHGRKVYGSKEDNEDALKYLAAIEITENQSKESIAKMIVKFVARSPDEDSSGLKQQLLKEFTPVEGCPLGAQLPAESLHRFEPSLFTIDNDISPIAFGNQTNPFTLAKEPPNLLGVDELLDLISKTAPQMGRLSVSTPSNMPFNEMASNCEALLIGKQQKMSAFMTSQAQQSSVPIYASDYNNAADNNITSSSPNEPLPSQGGNELPNQNNGAVSQNQSGNSHPMRLATEYQQQQAHFLQLPPSNPYDHFLKAAGC